MNQCGHTWNVPNVAYRTSARFRCTRLLNAAGRHDGDHTGEAVKIWGTRAADDSDWSRPVRRCDFRWNVQFPDFPYPHGLLCRVQLDENGRHEGDHVDSGPGLAVGSTEALPEHFPR